MLSIYQLKPAFQALLRPLARGCAKSGITANSMTLAAMCISLMLGGILYFANGNRLLFLLLPLWMFLRMAFNAIDGMLAREFGQKSALGAYLNELSDVVSDAALYLPFVAIAPFGWTSVGAVIFLSAIKRDRGIKDWGAMIEGHGGMLDRVDSISFSAPIFFHIVRFWWA